MNLVQIDSRHFMNLVQIDSRHYMNLVQIVSRHYMNLVQIDSRHYMNLVQIVLEINCATDISGLKVINVRALIKNSHVKTNKCTNVKSMYFFFAHTSASVPCWLSKT